MKTTRKKIYKNHLLQNQEQNCHYCGVSISHSTATIDHIYPKVNGGEDSLDNFVLACKWCNQTKTDYPYGWFMGFMEYLFEKSKLKKKHSLSLSGFPIRKPNEADTGKWVSRYHKLLKRRSSKIALNKVKSECETSESISSESETSLP